MLGDRTLGIAAQIEIDMAGRIEQRFFNVPADPFHLDRQAAFRIERVAGFRLQPAG